MAITSTGVGSGLDVENIVKSLMAVERRPAALLETAATGMKSQLSTYGQLQSYVSAFQDKSNAVNSLTLWQQTVASSSDATTATVTTGANAAPGSYSLSVANLASAQTVSSASFPSKTHSLGAGQLTIELGSWTGDPSTFGLKAGTSSVTVDIAPGESSLAAIRDKINAAGAGVTATIINDSTGARLSIRSKDTGAENGFKISATETEPPIDGSVGLSALTYDGTDTYMKSNQAAENAKATLNGIEIESASNTLTDVADGLTVKLLRKTTSPLDLSVTQDNASMKTAITDFVTAFNDLANFISTQTAYNPESKVAGKLQGDRTVIGIQNQMRSILRETSSASSKYTRLSDIGLEVQKDGKTLAIKSAKLDDALANPVELRKMLTSADETGAQSSGLIFRFKQMAKLALGTDGPLDTRSAGIKSSIERNAKRMEDMETRLAASEKRMRKQYQTLDTNMAKLNALSSYVSTQMSALNK
ncbi:MAG: hypothetical protein RLZZ618_3516 [Pseudomonadota bacterium]|jgi:flagellar hook-associated protein 2